MVRQILKEGVFTMSEKQKTYVSIKELAERFNLDRSNVRKYVLNQGFSFVKIRASDARGQLTLALSLEDAKNVIEIRERQGFLLEGEERAPIENGKGCFYIVQLIPELMSNRVKLGFAANIEYRLSDHRISAPTAILLKSWSSNKSWEKAAMASITRIECKNIGGEVFECENLETLLERAEAFFKIMP